MQKKSNKSLISFARELRKNMTKEENRLWYNFLSTYPVKFVRQKILGNYIADFYSAKARIIIELDGSQHYMEQGVMYDDERTKFLTKYDLTVIRIPNIEVNKNFDGVCEYIDMIVKGI